MKRVWYEAWPELLEQIKNEIRSEYPTLHLYCEEDVVFVRGTYHIIFEGETLDRYLVEIEFPHDYPEILPVVRETGGRIPRTPDYHMNDRGDACLFVPDERWWVLPTGSSFRDFLHGPFYNFFLSQALVSLGQPWPFGQRAHGADGIREFYTGLLGTSDLVVIRKYLECLSRPEIKGHWICPCGSGKKIRHCHLKQVRDLRSKIPTRIARKSLEFLKANK